eukprot:5771872-Pyramimonas_sp.AAC.1
MCIRDRLGAVASSVGSCRPLHAAGVCISAVPRRRRRPPNVVQNLHRICAAGCCDSVGPLWA